jgi:tetratricopeptide (TPR) repeat protein
MADQEDMPDWLADAEVAVSAEEIPDWLRETAEMEDPAAADIIMSPVESLSVETPPALVSPAPATAAPVSSAEADAALAGAREMVASNDLDGGLIEYERVIRANTALDQVGNDLTRLADQHKDNPAVYRLLGDCLMRQGKLQAALDTYRNALNQL